MANIRIDLNHAPLDGETVSFKAPCNASDIAGLVIYYPDGSNQEVSKAFTMNDANGNDLGSIDNIFAEGAIVKVVLDTDQNNAFVQNPDTNAYLEGQLAGKVNKAGDTMTGALTINAPAPAVKINSSSAGRNVQQALWADGTFDIINRKDTNNDIVFRIRPETVALASAFQFYRHVDGAQSNTYNILHTGNKPSGSYTGTNIASRTINTGGIGDVISIRCTFEDGTVNRVYYIHGDVAFWSDPSSKTVGYSADGSFHDGVLTTKNLNLNGSTNAGAIRYDYQVL